MKYYKILLFLVLIFSIPFIIFWGGLKWMNSRPCDTIPDRIINIPYDAVWKGSCEEGFWFKFIPDKEERKVGYHFRIYDDYEGKLVMDGFFMPCSDTCTNLPMGKKIISLIIAYEDNKILLKQGYCDLNNRSK